MHKMHRCFSREKPQTHEEIRMSESSLGSLESHMSNFWMSLTAVMRQCLPTWGSRDIEYSCKYEKARREFISPSKKKSISPTAHIFPKRLSMQYLFCLTLLKPTGLFLQNIHLLSLPMSISVYAHLTCQEVFRIFRV